MPIFFHWKATFIIILIFEILRKPTSPNNYLDYIEVVVSLKGGFARRRSKPPDLNDEAGSEICTANYAIIITEQSITSVGSPKAGYREK